MDKIHLNKELNVSLQHSVAGRYELYKADFDWEFSAQALYFRELIAEMYATTDGKIHLDIFRETSIPDILLFLRVSHHYYTSKLIPEIEQSLAYALMLLNGGDELWVNLSLFFTNYKSKLIEHIFEEEDEFFPILEKLHSLDKMPPVISEIKTFIAEENLFFITDHHDAIEDELAEIIKIVKLYVDDVDQSMPLRIFVNQINRFELELRNHAIIEDLLLMPMARKLENKLRALI